MAGLWDTGSKKQQASTLFGGTSGKSVWESSPGRNEWEEEEDKLKKFRTKDGKVKIGDMGTYTDNGDGTFTNAAGQKRTQDQVFKLAGIEANYQKQQQKIKDDNQWWKVLGEETGKAVTQVGAGIVAGAQQSGAAVADVALKGGAVLDEVALIGKSPEEQAKQREKNLKNTEKLRGMLKDQKDVTGQNLKGTSDDIGVNDLDDPRKVARLAGESLDVGLGATMFLNPTRAVVGGATSAKTGLSLGKQMVSEEIRNMSTKQAAKFAGRDAAFYGTLDAAGQTSKTYGETGDVGEALTEGVKTGLTSAAFQGALDFGGFVAGRGTRNAIKRNQKGDEVESISKGIDEVLENIDDQKKAQEVYARRQGTYEQGIKDIDGRIQNIDDVDYQMKHGLTRAREADAKYEEMTSDLSKVPGADDATKALQEAEEAVARYDEMRMQNPFARQVDSVRNEIQQIEATREKDFEAIRQMIRDGEVDPADAAESIDMSNARYEELIATKSAKIDELMQKNPNEAAELQMLDQADATVQTQAAEAQARLDDLVANQESLAKAEADRLRAEPDPEAVQYHKQALEYQKAQFTKALEKAKVRYESPNVSLKDVDDELTSIKVGTHPLVEGRKSPKVVEKHVADLFEQKGQQRAKKIAIESDQSVRELTPEQINEIAQVKSAEALEDSPYLREAINAKGDIFGSILTSFQQNEPLMDHLGLHKLKELRTSSSREHAKLVFEANTKLRKMSKEARGIKTKDLYDAADGVPGAYDKLDPRGKAVVDEWRDWAKDLGTKLGLPAELVQRGDYIPHLFADKGKSPEILTLQMRMKDAMDKVDSGLDEKEVARTITHIKKLDEQIVDLIAPDKRMDYNNFRKDNGDIFNRFLQKRTGAEGYQRNFFEAIDAYVDKANTQIAYGDYVSESARIINEKGMDRTIVATLESDIKNIRGFQHEWDKAINMGPNKLVERLGIADTPIGQFLHNTPTKVIRKTRMLNSLAMFGGNLASGVNTFGQVPAIAATLNADGLAVGIARASAIISKTGKETLTRSESRTLKKYIDMGVFEGNNPFIPDSFDSQAYGAMKSTVNGVIRASMSPLTGGDRMMRLITATGAEYKGRQRGLSGAQLDNYVVEAVRKANGDFSRIQAPRAFRSQVGKSLGQAVAWIPGMTFRMAETVVDSGKGAATIIGKVRGKDVTAGELVKAVDDVTKSLTMVGAVMGTSWALDQVTGQEEVVPNPFSREFYSTPAIQRLFGTDTRAGLFGLLPSRMDQKEYDENGELYNKDLKDRTEQFWTQTLPSSIIPGFSAWNKFNQARETNERGYSQTDSGRVRFMAPDEGDTQRLLFGQYSGKEGQEYLENMNNPGGGSLTERKSGMIKEASPEMQQVYYDFFRSADSISGRSDANAKVTELFSSGRPEAARRKADEFNAKVDEKMAEFFQENPYIDDDLQEELRKNVYITLTPQSESARSRQ